MEEEKKVGEERELKYNTQIEELGGEYISLIDARLLEEIKRIYGEILEISTKVLGDQSYDMVAKKTDIGKKQNELRRKMSIISNFYPELKNILKRYEYSTGEFQLIEGIKPFINPFPLGRTSGTLKHNANFIASVVSGGSVNDIIEYFEVPFTGAMLDNQDLDDNQVITKYLPLYCFLLDAVNNKETINFADLVNIQKFKDMSGKKKFEQTMREKANEESMKIMMAIPKKQEQKKKSTSGGAKHTGGQEERRDRERGNRRDRGDGERGKEKKKEEDLTMILKGIKYKEEDNNLYDYILKKIKKGLEFDDSDREKTNKFFIKDNGQVAEIDNKSEKNGISNLMFNEYYKEEKIEYVVIKPICVKLHIDKGMKSLFMKGHDFQLYLSKLEQYMKRGEIEIPIKSNKNLTITVGHNDVDISGIGGSFEIKIKNDNDNLKENINILSLLMHGIFDTQKKRGQYIFKETEELNNDTQMEVFRKIKTYYELKYFNNIETITENDLMKIRINFIKYLMGLYAFSYITMFATYEKINDELKHAFEGTVIEEIAEPTIKVKSDDRVKELEEEYKKCPIYDEECRMRILKQINEMRK